MEAAFEFLFKYRPVVFEKGRLVLAASWPRWLLLGAALALALSVVLAYRKARGRSGPLDRGVLGFLRLAVLLVVLVCLWRPALVVSRLVPQQSFVGVLVDDSRSMQVADHDGRSRGEAVRGLLATDGPLRRALDERFKVRLFRFSTALERVPRVSDLAFDGSRTELAAALDSARQELQGVPLAGLVLLSDGADTGHGGLAETLLQLKASGVGVHTVGIGRERFDTDVELSRVELPRSVLKGGTLVASVSVAQRGLAGAGARLVVEDGGRVVHAREIRLPGPGQAALVRAQIAADEAGPRRLRFRVLPLPGEALEENNHRDVLVHVRDGRERILYLEGEARYEPKFIRRAVADDRSLQLVTLERTAENKFLRLDVDDAEELAAGFPRSREELYRYRGLVLGSVEASFFSPDQLRMVSEFVSQRGGGLLVLGGRSALGEGGYAGTALAETLPVVVEAPARGAAAQVTELQVEPTPLGLTHAATQLAPTPEESERRWGQLPRLTATNPVRRTKPGAASLLLGRPERGEPQVVLAYHRYGRGQALVFAVQDSWLWQMHADVALEDMTHEKLWRQLLRWLVSESGGPVRLVLPEDRVAPGATVRLRAEVSDERFLRVNDARVVATVEDPAGERRDVPMEWTVEKDGEYQAAFVPTLAGVYQVRVEARRAGARLGDDRAYVEAADAPVEFHGAEMRAGLLRRIAQETGGRFYSPEGAVSLAEDLSYGDAGVTLEELRELWDMPAVYLLLVVLVSAEWLFRRLRGLA